MSDSKNKVVVRIAPSPTGNLHIGAARTALFNFLFAQKNKGSFILRIEDTDRERSKKEYEENIVDGLSWLGLKHDAFYRQSERTEVYKKYLKKLVDEGKAYISKEKPVNVGDRDEVVRFKNPNTRIKFKDLIRGEIEFDTTELNDFVIAKSLEEPLYHLAAVVDDFEMGVTHVIRGEDHISNTPRQILIGEALGAKRPQYAHIPLILAPDRSKLSKRHGAVAVTEYRDLGYLPEAMVNYLALLGWNPGGEEELFTLAQLVELFSLEKVQKGGAVFNIEKLNWVNREYLKGQLEIIRVAVSKIIKNDTLAEKITKLVAERVSTVKEITALLAGGELDFIKTPEYEKEKLVWKDSNIVNTKQHLVKISELIKNSPDSVFETASGIKVLVWEYAEKEGRGNVLWPMRFALTGRDKSPDPFTVAEILGKAETLKRLRCAIKKLNA